MNLTRKTVLILHSYDEDYAWVRDVNIGIERVLGDKKNVRVFRHYMDTKTHPDSKYKIMAGAIARRVVDYIKPDVVLASDDDAQQYVMRHYKNREDMQIVFIGVNAKPEQYDYQNAINVTGVLERIPYEAVKNVVEIIAKQHHIKPPYRVIHISDRSIIVKYDDINMHEYPNWAPVNLLKSNLVGTFNEWKDAIHKSADIADIILISNYRKVYENDQKQKFVPFKEVMEWSYKNAPLPIIGINGFVCEEGAALAIATSPIEQGEIGARIVVDILRGEVSAKDIPFQNSSFPMIYIDETRFNQSGYELPQLYVAFAKATNNFFEAKHHWGSRQK
ncbi:ABC transporter substrate-binding protein [Candidatus Paracaedibacter symbiosus]|uniref:ABC transporter substrate-binding protein n=1 Tax=Candidatus Paracaedibacter symbiosus TaxID=244582 RepID=UPI0012EC8855|nr:hypothetical protein [Candidatus Paracaedibacter symbiosus]